MYVSDCISVNERGHLTIGSYDTVELAKQFGTPAYIYDENEIRKNLREFKKSIDDNYGGNGLVVYASKAFCCKEMCRICEQEGTGIDVVSGGELYTALSVGFPTDKIVFHGNNKTCDELEMAVQNDVGRVIVDNVFELETLNEIAAKHGKTVGIMLRIKPGIDAHTHDFVKTGQIDSKFGFALETGEAMEGIKKALEMPHIKLKGLHCHIGSQIFDLDPFELAATVMLDLFKEVKEQTGVELEELNLGGGFGIKYLKSDRPRPYGDYMRKVSDVVNRYSAELGLKTPFILIEPGRSVVGAAGLTLYTVGAVKKIPDVRTYVSIDGGMGDNPRYALYQSHYELICANKASEKREATVTVAGKCCESGDLIQEWTHIQPVEPGDIIAVLSTGAYNYSMASNYNRIPRLPVIMVKDGKARVVVKRETYEQITECDV
ncbi:MAG: diaminopimelate decarboxylase [Oscillospiraceae bacterium]|nr:diaminopimelate decarboxylase [Clostridiaceae bacterium]MDO4494454.1 diaminopimelate decarboxylase [Clostridiaceae bacterium]MDY5948179.1 diaminopimelate decarboxylase [Oscillospiraceae bacterium]